MFPHLAHFSYAADEPTWNIPKLQFANISLKIKYVHLWRSKENSWLAVYLTIFWSLSPFAPCLVLMLMMCHGLEICGLPFRLPFLHSSCWIKHSPELRQPTPPTHQHSKDIRRQQKTNCKQLWFLDLRFLKYERCKQTYNLPEMQRNSVPLL